MTPAGPAPATPRLIRNAVQCNACLDVIESRALHHRVKCSCGQCYVDGGLAYSRCGFGDAGCTDLCEYAPPAAGVPPAG
jgi:hypothetical protein